MGSKKNTITINGRVYDTTTGEVVATSMPLVTVITPTESTNHVSRHESHHSPTKKIAVKSSSKEVLNDNFVKPSSKVHRDTPKTAANLHKKTIKTKTLMRNTVKRPSTIKNNTASIAISGLAQQPEHKIVHSKIPERSLRASSIEKNVHVSRFATNTTTVTKKVENIPVKIAPKKHNSSVDTPYISKQAPPISVKPVTKKSQDIFETAMQNATSHRSTTIGGKKSHHKRTHDRIIKVGAIAAIIVVLGAFYTYNNVPNLALRSSSSRTGFAASVPKYKPTGFSLNRSVEYQPGRVVLSYNSRIDNRSFNVIQEKTTINNTDIPEQVLRGMQNYYPIQTKEGNTIYVYNNSNATWVNNGIWYNIQGNANLSARQLLSVASSLK